MGGGNGGSTILVGLTKIRRASLEICRISMFFHVFLMTLATCSDDFLWILIIFMGASEDLLDGF